MACQYNNGETPALRQGQLRLTSQTYFDTLCSEELVRMLFWMSNYPVLKKWCASVSFHELEVCLAASPVFRRKIEELLNPHDTDVDKNFLILGRELWLPPEFYTSGVVNIMKMVRLYKLDSYDVDHHPLHVLRPTTLKRPRASRKSRHSLIALRISCCGE